MLTKFINGNNENIFYAVFNVQHFFFLRNNNNLEISCSHIKIIIV